MCPASGSTSHLPNDPRTVGAAAGTQLGLVSLKSARYNQRVHFVYMVRCADDTLYTGYARDPVAREEQHNRGRGAKYTAGRRPVQLVYQEAFRTVGKALKREHAVKQLTRAQKNALIVSARR